MENALKFRKNALDHVTSLGQSDQTPRIVPPKFWLVLLVLLSILVAFALWSVFGIIPARVEGSGILLYKAGSIYVATAPTGTAAAGNVEKILVKPGSLVKKGQSLALLKHPGLEKEVEVTKSYLGRLRERYISLASLAKTLKKQRQEHLEQQKQILLQMIVSEEANLKQIQELVAIQKAARRKGLNTKQNVVNTMNQYYASKARIARYYEGINHNEIAEANFMDKWDERLRLLDLRIRDEQYKLNNLLERLTLSKDVLSPVAGVVLAIRKTVGDAARSGDAVVSIATKNQGMDAVLFVQPKDGKQIRQGMKAYVAPGNIKKAEYGSILGEVIEVFSHPATRDDMMAVLHNETLIAHFAQNGARMMIRVRLKTKSSTPSGFAWSSSRGPDQIITTGTLATVTITVREYAPITMLIPTLKKMFHLA